MINLINRVKEKALISRVIKDNYALIDKEEIVNKLFNCFDRNSSEYLYLLLFNKSTQLTEIKRVASSEGLKIRFEIEKVLYPIISSNTSKFILAHNHPSKIAKPSFYDYVFTHRIQKYTSKIESTLDDHLIWTSNEIYSFKVNKIIGKSFDYTEL